MLPLINNDVFIKIFQNTNYRIKLDKIILDFFGISPKDIIKEEILNDCEITLEFVICIEKQLVMKILVKDTKGLFRNSKKFYINFSGVNKIRSYQLVYPCYWEFYCQTCLKKGKIKKDIEYLAALLAATQSNDIKSLLKRLKVFNKSEINDIMNIIEDSKYLI